MLFENSSEINYSTSEFGSSGTGSGSGIGGIFAITERLAFFVLLLGYQKLRLLTRIVDTGITSSLYLRGSGDRKPGAYLG